MCVEKCVEMPCCPTVLIANVAAHNTHMTEWRYIANLVHTVNGLYCGRCNVLIRICVSGKGTQHPCVKVNMHYVCVWGSENPRAIVEHVMDSTKVAFCLGLRAVLKCTDSLLLGKQVVELSTVVA